MGNITTSVGVIDKTIAVLAATNPPAHINDLIERTGLPRATVHRLAVSLELHRMLQRNDQGAWEPGPRLLELSGARDHILAGAAQSSLEALTSKLELSSQLYVRRGDHRICIAHAEPSSGLRDTVPLGAALPLLAGSGAHILLAWEPEKSWETFLAGARFTRSTLQKVKEGGFARSEGERQAGIASCSAPVRDRNNQVIAAISLSGPANMVDSPEAEKALIRAGKKLSGLV